MFNTNIIKTSGLKTLNAWRVKIGSYYFIITPAHNIIYKPDSSNIFKPSPFVPAKFNSDWFVPEQYIKSSEYDLLNDLAWKPIGQNSQSIQSDFIDINHIYKTNYYYFQPYDYTGNKVSKSNYSLGCGQTVIYKSPSNKKKVNILKQLGWVLEV